MFQLRHPGKALGKAIAMDVGLPQSTGILSNGNAAGDAEHQPRRGERRGGVQVSRRLHEESHEELAHSSQRYR